MKSMKNRIISSGIALLLVLSLLIPSTEYTSAAPKPKKSSITSVRLYSVNASKCTVKVNVKKGKRASGVQVKLATNKKFKKAKTKKSTSSSILMGNVSPNKTYYVKVRSYKKSGRTRYSGWSKTKKFRFTTKDIQNFQKSITKPATQPKPVTPTNPTVPTPAPNPGGDNGNTGGTENSGDSENTNTECQHTQKTSYTDIDRGEVYGGAKTADEEYYPKVVFCHFCYKTFINGSGSSHDCTHWCECSHNTPEYRLQPDGFVHGTGLSSWGTIAFYVKGYRVAPTYQDVTTTKKTYCKNCKKLLSKETKTEKTTVSEEKFEPTFLEDGSLLPTKNGYNETYMFKNSVHDYIYRHNATTENAEHEWNHVNEAYTGIYW